MRETLPKARSGERMAASGLVPLEDDWRETLDGVARSQGWATSAQPAKVSAELAKLSAAYNEASDERARVRESASARMIFSFARDVPKAAGAVRELVACGALAVPSGRPLRVLDLGAGLGASTWGVVRALAAAKQIGEVEAVWVDEDADALRVGNAIVAARQRSPQGPSGRPLTLHVRTAEGSLAGWTQKGPRFDLVLLGQVLSEEGREAPDRVARHAARLASLLSDAVAPDGSLVVVEPALRERTRHLHAVRDALVSGPAPRATLFAPCLHALACPALVHPTDWCHEDLAVDLPPWLIPIARGAGLRWQGLTFSYLVLRRDGKTLRGALNELRSVVRVVSGPLDSKGKREAFVCGDLGDGDARTSGRVRAMRLDRDAQSDNAAWDDLQRGTLLCIEPALDAARPRIGRPNRVEAVAPVAPSAPATEPQASAERASSAPEAQTDGQTRG